MFYGGDDDLFDFTPDMDFDGDHDLEDYLLHEDLLEEEAGLFEPSWSDDTDFDDDEDGDDSDSDGDFEISLCFVPSVSVEDEEDEEDEDENLLYIERRKKEAREYLEDRSGWRSVDMKRCKFIAFDESIAARYLTVDGIYLYAQAVKDHFKLPFDIPDELDCAETPFTTLLSDLAECDVELALTVWEWCLDTFMPYIEYEEYKDDLTSGVLLSWDDFDEAFWRGVVTRMVESPKFLRQVILQAADSLWSIEEFISLALEGGHIDTAKTILQYAFENPHSNVHDKKRYVDACISVCVNYDENDTMKLFQKHVFPVVFGETDVRIQNKIPRWQKEMQEYVDEMDEQKYGWRADCFNELGVSPGDYETRAEYDAAVRAAYAKQRAEREQARAADPNDRTIYAFCQVSLNGTAQPHYYYFTGDLILQIGDRVVVSFGKNNAPTEATVVSVGTCYGCAFPCKVELIKTVAEKIDDSTL